MRIVVASLSLGVALVACGPAEKPPIDGPTDLRMEIPEGPAPGEGFQIVSPDIVVPKGKDIMHCWVPDLEITEDRMMDAFVQLQSPHGHHLFGLRSIIPRQPGEQFDCTEVDDMATVEPLISATVGGSEGVEGLLAPDFAVKVPAGTQIVMQSHYVNITDNDILVRDVGNFYYLPPGVEKIEASYLVLNGDRFDIPPTNTLYQHTSECTVAQRFQFNAMIGHMHEWGKRIFVQRVDGEGTVHPLYEEASWTAAFRDAPPVMRWPLDAPMVFEAGDTMRVTCEWVNNTDEPLRFPNEMCVAMWVYYPALPEGFIVCD